MTIGFLGGAKLTTFDIPQFAKMVGYIIGSPTVPIQSIQIRTDVLQSVRLTVRLDSDWRDLSIRTGVRDDLGSDSLNIEDFPPVELSWTPDGEDERLIEFSADSLRFLSPVDFREALEAMELAYQAALLVVVAYGKAEDIDRKLCALANTMVGYSTVLEGDDYVSIMKAKAFDQMKLVIQAYLTALESLVKAGTTAMRSVVRSGSSE